MSGTITDANGGIIAGASVSLVNDQTKTARTVATNDSGRFDFAAVHPGPYSLKVEHQGFQTLLKQNVVLSANENLALGEIELAARTGERDGHGHERRRQSSKERLATLRHG